MPGSTGGWKDSKSFDEFLERRFPESRRKAYYLMSIHEHLPPQVRKELKQVGWTKGRELAMLARKQGQQLRKCTLGAQSPDTCRGRNFRREIEKALTGKDSEPSELIYFKVYKSQMPVIEQAIEMAALMLGSDKSRGYCLEMICADFLAGAHMDGSRSRGLAAVDLSLLQVPAQRTAEGVSLLRLPKGLMKKPLSKTASDSTRFRELSPTASPSAGARWMAMPIVRQHAAVAGPPHEIPQSSRVRTRSRT